MLLYVVNLCRIHDLSYGSLTSLQSSAGLSSASVPGQAWKTDTAPQAQKGFSCGLYYQGTAHLNGPSDTTQHTNTHTNSLVLHLYQSETSSVCVCVGGGALTAGCQNKTCGKHLIHPCSDGSDSLINVPTFFITKTC